MTTKHTPIFDNYGNVSVGNYVGGLDSLPDAYALQCSINADLLAALQNLTTRWDRGETPIASDWTKARAAIARAKGQA